MNTGNDDFEQLRGLLRLKRHETPPPGYFNHLSGRIISRLETEPAPGVWQQMLGRWTWLESVRTVLAQNPVSAGVLAFCSVLVVTLANSPLLDNWLVADAQPVLATNPGLAVATAADAGNWRAKLNVNSFASVPAGLNLNPVFATESSSVSFNSGSLALPVNYTLGQQ